MSLKPTTGSSCMNVQKLFDYAGGTDVWCALEPCLLSVGYTNAPLNLICYQNNIFYCRFYSGRANHGAQADQLRVQTRRLL
jgi:hypothetical protein